MTDTRPPAPPQLPVLRACLVAFLVLLVPAFLPQLFFTNKTVTPGALPLMLAIAAPWLLSSILLFNPPLLYSGLTLAAAASIVMLVPLVPYLAVATLFLGFMAGNSDQELAYVSAIAATSLLLVVAVLATRLARGVPREARTTWGWLASFGSTIAYALIVTATVSSSNARMARQGAISGANSENARLVVETIARCAAGYAEQYPDRGYPTSLADLTGGASPCVSAAVAAGEADGYRYHYLPAIPDASGAVRGYNACAEPVKYAATGSYTIVVDQTGTSPGLQSPSGTRGGISCRGAWSRDYVKAIRYCAAEYAAAHPDKGYPATLGLIGPKGSGCLATIWDEYRYDENSHFGGDALYTYVAAPPGASGRVTAYEIHANHHDGWHEFAADAGDVRGVVAKRLATPRDEIATVVAEHARAWNDADTVKPLCDSGTAAACRTLAELLLKNGPAARGPARMAYEHGCELSDGESCVALARLMSGQDGPTTSTKSLFERACANGSGDACVWLARDLGNAPEPVQVERYLNAGCEFGEPFACTRLADRLAQTDPARARRLWIKACGALEDDEQKECAGFR